MEFPQLEAFLEAASRGSFRRAADALCVSQPSVSARVQTLEDEVGVVLFHRNARGVRLTDMGRTFLPFAQRAMETLRRGREVLESVRQASSGILNMATARVIGTYVLPETLQKFHDLYPDANLHIKVGGSSDVLQMVVDEEVQLGLARFMQHPDVDALHLYDEEAVLVVHPDHPFAKAGVAGMREVALEPLILYDPGDPGSSYFQFINRLSREAGVTPKVEMNLDSGEEHGRIGSWHLVPAAGRSAKRAGFRFVGPDCRRRCGARIVADLCAIAPWTATWAGGHGVPKSTSGDLQSPNAHTRRVRSRSRVGCGPKRD